MIKFKGRLTDHFSSEEYSKDCKGDVYLTRDAYQFCLVLEATRKDVGLKFYVNSFYRTPELNKEKGGISSSNHLRGCACDFHLTNKVTRSRFIKIVKSFKKHCKAAGVIGEAGLYDNWIHLGIQNETQRAINDNKFIQWDFRGGKKIYNNILELKD